MKKINIYFAATTKVQIGHLEIEDNISIETKMQEWIAQGYAKIHYMNNSIFIYVPWGNVNYCQYATQNDANLGHESEQVIDAKQLASSTEISTNEDMLELAYDHH